MTTIKIGCIQFAPRFGELAHNRRRIADLISRAPTADLLVLPELCVTGYAFENLEQARALAEPASKTAESVRMFSQLAKDKGCTIVAGYDELGRDDNLYISAVVVTPDGLAGVYRKTHLSAGEKSLFQPGSQFKVFDLPLREGGTAKLGVLICFDWMFPESWRTLKLMGADIVAMAANLVTPGSCQRAVPVMAMMNRLAVAMANRFGEERQFTFTGESLVVDERGNELARSPATGESTIAETVELEKIRDPLITPRNHLFAARRPELYSLISDSSLAPPSPVDELDWFRRP